MSGSGTAALTAPTLDDAKIVVERWKSEPLVSEVLLYGSVAHGEATPDSDIDFMVVADISKWDEVGGLSAWLERAAREVTPWHCQVVVRPHHMWEHLVNNVSASFEAAVRREAVALYEHPNNGSRPCPTGSLADVPRDNLDLAAQPIGPAELKTG